MWLSKLEVNPIPSLLAWDDPALAIDWPSLEILLSDKDRVNPVLGDSSNLPLYEAG